MGQLALSQVRNQRDQQRHGTVAGGGHDGTDQLRLHHGMGVEGLIRLCQQLWDHRDLRDQRVCGAGVEVGQHGTEAPRLLHGQEVASLIQQGQQLRDLYAQHEDDED